MTAPTSQTVASFLGRPGDQGILDVATEHLPVVTAFVRAYTRGGGFDSNGVPSDDVAAVIVTAAARLVVNPEQAQRVQVADYAETPAVLNGFTLPELAVLHQYRRRAL